MEADATTLLNFIKDNQKNQLVIPIYQRLYSWEKEQCKQLWDDIIKIGGNDKMDGHFIGSILYVLDGLRTLTMHYSSLTANKDSPLSRFYSPL